MARVRAESQRNLQTEAALRVSIRHQLGGHGFRWKEETMAFHHHNSLPTSNPQHADRLVKYSGPHLSFPHAHIISSTSMHAMPKTARGRITANHGGTTTNCGWVVSDSRETCKTNPCSGSRRQQTCSFEGPEHRCSCHSLGGISTSQPVCCLPRYFCIYCDVFTSDLSLDTDGRTYLIFVLLHTAFPNDCMRFQESEQWYTIPTGDGRVCCLLHWNIHAHY